MGKETGRWGSAVKSSAPSSESACAAWNADCVAATSAPSLLQLPPPAVAVQHSTIAPPHVLDQGLTAQLPRPAQPKAAATRLRRQTRSRRLRQRRRSALTRPKAQVSPRAPPPRAHERAGRLAVFASVFAPGSLCIWKSLHPYLIWS